ncbi:MAG: acyl-CoA dehydrogenase [Candidatus Aenigmarchaeota archaeon]|nr:acyl-CoA dehydrogenase [Candidatus Aenigmarchaeota archaeon]
MFTKKEATLKQIYDNTPAIEEIKSASLTTRPEYFETVNIFLEGVRDFSKDKITPLSGSWDRVGAKFIEGEDGKGGKVILPPGMNEIYSEIARLGWTGTNIPQEYEGGAGLGLPTYCALTEFIGRGDASIAIRTSTHDSCASLISKMASEEVKDELLPYLAQGKYWGAIALTEDEGGSNLRGIKTKAKLEGDEWIINGKKKFISNGGLKNIYIVSANTEKGMSTFIVKGDSLGFDVTGIADKAGLKASPTARITLDNVAIPKEYLLGEEGKGDQNAKDGLIEGRASIAATFTGVGQAALTEADDYANGRTQFGRPIIKFEIIKQYLDEMLKVNSKSRYLYLDAANEIDNKTPGYLKRAAEAKFFATEASVWTTKTGAQIHGGTGYMTETRANQLKRDSEAGILVEGTSEIQMHIIMKELKKANSKK